MKMQKFIKTFERKAGALLLGRCFYDENTLCSQDSLKWLLSGIELNMHKLFAFTCFLRAKAPFATVFYSRIGLLSHRRYASSLLFTCVYWMESRRFVFVDGAFKGNTLFARFTLRVLEWDWVEQVFTCFLHVKRALYLWKRWFHKWKNILCSQNSCKGLLNGFEFSTWMQSGRFTFGKVMLRGKDTLRAQILYGCFCLQCCRGYYLKEKSNENTCTYENWRCK